MVDWAPFPFRWGGAGEGVRQRLGHAAEGVFFWQTDMAPSEKIVDGIGQGRIVDELADNGVSPLVGMVEPRVWIDRRVD